jgi:hypothetical protein
MTAPKPFANPYAGGVDAVAPAHADANAYYRAWTSGPRSPLESWIVFEVLGIFAGAFGDPASFVAASASASPSARCSSAPGSAARPSWPGSSTSPISWSSR